MDLTSGSFAVLAQKPAMMFRALDFSNQGVFATTRIRAKHHSESRFGFL
jgi:hypothetical protein